MIVLRHRLRRWWNIATIWPICFAVLFGLDIASIDFARTFDLFSLLEIFASGNQLDVVYPAMLPVIAAMLEEGLKVVTRDQSDPDSPFADNNTGKNTVSSKSPVTPTPIRQRSMTLDFNTSGSSMLSQV